jgi:hypothetical protein
MADETIESGVPASAPPEEVLKWMLFWLKGYTNSMTTWTQLLATQPGQATHPQTVELLIKRAQQMNDIGEQVSDYLHRRESGDGKNGE